MLRGAIISPDLDLSERLEEALSGLGIVSVVRTVERYPTAFELLRMLRANAPQVVFLSIESLSRALEVVSLIDANIPGIQVVAVNRTCDPQTLLEVMRAGLREFVSMPFHRQTLYDALVRIQELVERKPPALEACEMVFSFLPAKPGVGATTIAVNAAVAVARLSDMYSLLMDLDQNSGMVRFLLQLENTFSVTDAAERAHTMDENIWPQLVSKLGSLDVLHSGALNPEFRLETSQLRNLLDFARRNYKAIMIDLSGNMERFSLEIMHDSRRVFLVTTPEIPSLHLAREKLAYLRNIELGDRISLLLNRCQKKSVVSPSQVEDLLGLPVTMSFANDYQGVHKALTMGKPVEAGSDLGKQFAQLAQLMADKKPALQSDSKKRFVEYFSILPSRYSLFPENKKPAV